MTSSDTQQVGRHLAPARSTIRRPRLGFLGVGWIGRHRLEAVATDGTAEIAAIADSDGEAAAAARHKAPDAVAADSLDELLNLDLDGLVIATPSGLHAQQATAALESGLAVFCQKPLARTASETRTIIEAARQADRLLGVDLSYRFVVGVPEMRLLIQSGALGRVYAAELTFHNAYGPDKPWFYNPALAGGGCVIDLGTHLADLALWMFDDPEFENVEGRLFRHGRPLEGHNVEDYAFAQWDLRFRPPATTSSTTESQNREAPPQDGNVAIRLACSWGLPAGRDAIIEATFYGTDGAVALRNINGSFYDFVIERFRGTQREQLAGPPDDWGGRAIVDWTRRLARSPRFDPACQRLADTAALIDAIYGR